MRQQITQPEKVTERLRGVGNSSGDANGSDSVKRYWEIIGDNLSEAGWSWGCVSAVDSNGQTIWIANAHRDNGPKFVVRSEEKLTAFLELESAVRAISSRNPASMLSASLQK
jgi:hypothetical protein